MFDGNSDIKVLINQLNEKTNINNLKKYIPFSEEDQKELNKLEEQKAELQSLKKDKEIENLKEVSILIQELIKKTDSINDSFNQKLLSDTKNAITDYITKRDIAQNEGKESFKSDLIKNIGSYEWKAFIEAAEAFSKKQEKENYPEDGDYCLLCQQPLSEESQILLLKYWEYIRSFAGCTESRRTAGMPEKQ